VEEFLPQESARRLTDSNLDALARAADLRQLLLIDPIAYLASRTHYVCCARWEKLRSKISSASRFFIISIEPPAIIQPRVRRTQYSTSISVENPIPPIT